MANELTEIDEEWTFVGEETQPGATVCEVQNLLSKLQVHQLTRWIQSETCFAVYHPQPYDVSVFFGYDLLYYKTRKKSGIITKRQTPETSVYIFPNTQMVEVEYYSLQRNGTHTKESVRGCVSYHQTCVCLVL